MYASQTFKNKMEAMINVGKWQQLDFHFNSSTVNNLTFILI